MQIGFESIVDDGTTLTLTLPWPPSVNAYWRHALLKGTNRVITYKTHEARSYCDAVGWICKAARKFPETAEVLLDIVLHPPDARRRDGDNFNKGVWDSLVVAGVLADDCQVQSYRVTKGAVQHGGGCVIVKITERNRVETEVQSEGRELSRTKRVPRKRPGSSRDGEAPI